MKRKRYDVKGMMEWHPVFKAGRTRLQVSFTGGHLCGGANTPASFETDDPVVQTVIEGSEAYRSGRIRIGLEIETSPGCSDSAPKKYEDPNRADASKGMTTCVFEYGDIDDISDFLQFQKGVPLESLNSEEAIFAQACLLGVELKKKKS